MSLDAANQRARDRIYEIARIYRDWEEQERNTGRAGIYHNQYQLIVEEVLQGLDEQFTQTYGKLVQAKGDEDERGKIIQTLRIIEVLREVKKMAL